MKRTKHKTRSYVAKHMHKSNRPAVHKDKKKEEKAGIKKHKKPIEEE